jgi:sugar lactone lactonase YvrE
MDPGLPHRGETGVNFMSSESNSGRLFFLDLGAGRILSVNPDGSDLKTVLTEGQGPHPDGVVVDAARGHIYWTNMGGVSVPTAAAGRPIYGYDRDQAAIG